MIQFNQPYNREEFTNFLRRDFLPDDFEQEESSISFATQTKYSKQAIKLGVCKSLDLVVYEVIHTGKDDPRVGLSKEAFRMLSEEWQDRALVLFVPQDNPANFRFSLIEITLEGSQDSAKISRKYSNPRRYSYVLGTEAKVRTPDDYLVKKGRVANWEDLQKRFSVEVLTKEFYGELSDWYAWAINIVKFPNDINTDDDDTLYNTESVIRMITRLIFVWFLKQKKLIPDQFFDETYIRENLLKNFAPHAKDNLFWKSEDSKYYKAILQNLFFAMLNSPMTAEGKSEVSERKFKENRSGYDNNKLMRYKDKFTNPELFLEHANSCVPFLNGGLFDCLDDKDNGFYLDGFSDREVVQKSLVVPDYLFFGEEVGKNVDLTEFYGYRKIVNARGIIDILKRYNFTIEENMPFDQEVSLDPELLGKVFENLLASYNPETKTTARKQTGSFYTPREIVQYMVDESLIAHLKRTVGEELEDEYRKLMQYTDDEATLTNEQKSAIIRSLQNCKVLDPACGSGAFPVGMLQQMVHILSQLDPNNEIWKNLILENSIKELSSTLQDYTAEEREEFQADINRSFDDSINCPDYARKLYLIENCIYGVDIQSIAVQISKLRFFISLVVDQKPNNSAADNFGIRPLPNLEAKFVAANTLIGLKKSEATLFDIETIKEKNEQLRKANHKLFSVKNYKTKRKWKETIKTLGEEIADLLQDSNVIGDDQAKQLAQWDMFDQNGSSPFFDPEWMFGVSGGFDIVIGNPPYLKEGRASKSVFDGVRESKYYQGKMDLWYMFACCGIDFLNTNGVLCFIATNNWVTNSGASIMRNKVVSDSKILQLCDFSNFMIFESASIQTMVMLFEKDNQSDDYTIDYRRLKGDTVLSDVIALLSKTNTPKVEYLTPTFNRKSIENKYITFSSNEAILDKISNANNVIYLTNNEIAQGIVFPQDFLNKKNQELLGHNFRVGQGIFALTEDEKKNLNYNNSEIALIKPYYTTEQIKRYYSDTKNNLWIIYTDSSFKNPNSMNNYPNLKSHLDKYVTIITSDNKPYGLHRAREERFFKDEKIIALRKCVDRPLFSYSNCDCYVSQTFNIIKTNRVNIKYLIGLLNSKLVKFWLKNRGKMQGLNYQLDKEPLVAIPIAVPSQEIQTKIATLVDYIIWLKANQDTAINDYVDNEYVSVVIEDIIDALIFEIYFPCEFVDKSVNLIHLIDSHQNVRDFYNGIKAETSILLNQIKLIKVELKDILMPILSL